MKQTWFKRLLALALCVMLVLIAALPVGADFGDYSGDSDFGDSSDWSSSDSSWDSSDWSSDSYADSSDGGTLGLSFWVIGIILIVAFVATNVGGKKKRKAGGGALLLVPAKLPQRCCQLGIIPLQCFARRKKTVVEVRVCRVKAQHPAPVDAEFLHAGVNVQLHRILLSSKPSPRGCARKRVSERNRRRRLLARRLKAAPQRRMRGSLPAAALLPVTPA